MTDQSKTKQALIQELASLRQRVAEMEGLESVCRNAEERLCSVNECLLNLGNDVSDNIRRLTALAGELMGATASIYNRLEGDMLVAVGQWQTPTGFKTKDRAQGHLCYDVICKNEERIVHIRNLAESPYAETDPNVCAYGLATYIGHVVRLRWGSEPIGSLCVVFQRDFIPTVDDERLLGILASSLGAEEKRRLNENALRESEEQMLMAEQIGGTGSWVYNIETNKIRGSAEGLRIFGYPPVARDWPIDDIEACIPERERVHQALVALISEGREYNLEHAINPADGSSSKVIHSIARLEKDAQGTPHKVLGFIQNITDRKRAEEALRESEKGLSEAQRIAHVGSWELDIQTHALLWSDETFRLFAVQKGTFNPTMKTYFKCVHPDDRSMMNAVTQAAWYKESHLT